jgi:hypothetical protein
MSTETQLKTATLRLVPRSADVTIRAGVEGERHYSAIFHGPKPTIREDDDTVTVRYPRFRGGPPFWHSRGEIRLDPSIAWEIFVDGGVSDLAADLSGLPLRSLEIMGGASDVEVTLPEPAGAVSVRIRGGASKVNFRRPAGVPARVRVGGGASKLTLDDEHFGAVGGQVRLASLGGENAVERYDIAVDGGANRLSVTTEWNGSGQR